MARIRAFALTLVPVALVATTAGYPYTIVMKSGGTFEAAGPPSWDDGKVVFELPGGSRGFLPEAIVDRAATEAANVRPEPLGPHYHTIAAGPEEPSTPVEPAPPEAAPPLGAIAPGGKSKSSFRQADLEAAELALEARSPEELERKMKTVAALHARLKRQYQELGLQIDRIEKELASLQGRVAALTPPEPAPQAAAATDGSAKTYTNVDLLELP